MRIAATDIETAPATAHVWRTGQQFVGLEQLITPPRMLCFAVRFNDEKRTRFYSEWEHGRERMVAEAWRMLDEADAVMHYNGVRFDTPWLFTELKRGGYNPPSPFKQIDLYEATKKFQLASHKLQHVSTHLLNLEGKLQHGGFSLWPKAISGDVKAQRLMRRYNIQDVDLLWEAYDELGPWLKLPIHADLLNPGNPLDDDPTCVCGSANLQRRGFAYTKQSKYQRFQCQDCGRWTRSTRRQAGVQIVEV